jgi:hypothetical protein
MMLSVGGREAIMAGGTLLRDASKEQFWREHIATQAASGLSIRGYCRRQRLRECSFYLWRKQLAASRSRPVKSAAFVPVRITSEPGAASGHPIQGQPMGRIQIVLGKDRRVNLVGPVDRRALADVLAVLEDRPC